MYTMHLYIAHTKVQGRLNQASGIYLSIKSVFVEVNSAGLDEVGFTVYQSTCLPVSIMKMVNPMLYFV